MALAILSISLGLLLQSFSTSMRGIALSETYTKAVMLADSRLEEVGVITPLAEGVNEGDAEEGLHWRVSVTPYEEKDADYFEKRISPYLIKVEVHWTEGTHERNVELSTLRLAVSNP